ncbi:perilipin-3-like [Eublepharis macularius]|uniref:Perilipin n=1 Tax=Eublepharis macularius TaxID=481883 RepID=A0AA97L6I5_EUBMA|nr:perilipin-3-like [Eublepharis macularius]
MTSKGQEEPVPSSESREEVQPQSVISRVTNLPLVSSTYDMAVSAYASTKENYPSVKAVLDLAEKGMKQISDVAATRAQPLLMNFEPQVSAAGQYASMGLDKLEEKLPILHQTANQVIADTQEVVLSKVAGAKEAVTKAVQSGKEMVLETRMGKMALSGAEVMLEKSEELLDHFLPMMSEELAELADSAPVGMDTASENQGYFVRLGSLSSKLRHRAYQHAVVKVKMARDNIKDAFSRLHQYIGQIERTKEDVLQEGQKNLSQVETQILDTSSRIAQQLKRTFKNLIANIEGLPSNLQHNMQQAYFNMEELHVSFASAQCFHDLSSSILSQSQENALKAQDYVEDVLEYVVNNTPLSWLVGPLAPGLNQSGDVAKPTRSNDGQEKALKASERKENL